ncbi:laccase-14 [Cucurbita moschata]|uniref:Laccase n=1 Tax=Cucurbita moschata TaxID=3662 RepID=A0A6J1EPR2_CUCMO|nr:laccase-14 [Cucurbita moschata]
MGLIGSIGFTSKLSWLLICCILVVFAPFSAAKTHRHSFVVKLRPITRLCSSKNILTVNGKFPGPTLEARTGDRIIVRVINKSKYNITFHWHGVKQVRNPWYDGPEYVTQCPILPGKKFTYKVQLTNEEGTIWWHAHSGWARATVHGPLIIYPAPPSTYPFPKPHAQIPFVIGEWWKKDVMEIPDNAKRSGGEPILSDAYTINGQPGYFYPCSKKGTFELTVERGKTYLLRMINAVMDEDLFFAIAKHEMTLVGKDGIYMKQIKTNYIMITPGQSMDLLITANQAPGTYFMATRSYSSAFGAGFDNTTATAILKYSTKSSIPSFHFFPTLPPYDRTEASTDFTKQFRSLTINGRRADVPLKIDTRLLFTLSVNLLNCSTKKPCAGAFGKRFAASVNNVSFVAPSLSLLQAYYYKVPGVFTRDFPKNPTRKFNYTAEVIPEALMSTSFGTRVMVLEYNASVELVLQGTNVVASDNHPVHLHGYSFYVVGWGFGNFDPKTDTKRYNLVDPPEETTVGVPKNGWVAIRFKANNPGMWLMHCHLERHQVWGMSMVFLVKNGHARDQKIVRPPHDLPKCYH